MQCKGNGKQLEVILKLDKSSISAADIHASEVDQNH